MQIERVYLIRHGQTDWNATGRYQGFADTALDATGKAQATRLAAYLAHHPIRAVYSSDLQRAHQTAVPLATALMLEVLPEPRLREIHVGIFQGMTGTEIDARYPEERTAYRADPFNYINPGGESRQQLQERAYAAWQDITAAELGPEVAIVAHGGTIKMLLLRLFESDAPGLSNVRFGNASITTVTRSGDGWRLTGLAATPHLDSAAL